MGRWKMGPQGGYYDASDSGPDQYTPTAAEAAQANPPAAPASGYQPPTGGIAGRGTVDPGTITDQGPMGGGYPAPGQGGAFGDGAHISVPPYPPAASGGGWSMNGGPGGPWQAILQELLKKFGGGGAGGAAIQNIQRQLPGAGPNIQPPSSGGLAKSLTGRLLGNSIFGM